MSLEPVMLFLAASPSDQPSMLQGLLLPAVVFAIFYLVVFAPMRKRQKKHGEMLGQLKAGDHVVTSGGIHGTVVAVTDDLVHLKIAEKVKIEVLKSAISDRRGSD